MHSISEVATGFLPQAQQIFLDLPPAEVEGQIMLPLLLQEEEDEKPEEE